VITAKKSVYVAYTGGTIGMKKIRGVWKPEEGFLQKQVYGLPMFYAKGVPEFDIKEFDPLLDSSNMTPNDWVKIAEDIKRVYKKYDGFVVLHGTDTMAYTASALAFMFEKLQKPVIVTGSQVPMIDPRTDGRQNLLRSIIIAANANKPKVKKIPEVGLYFDSELYRGCRSVKINCDGFHAFDSPNLPPLARSGINLKVNNHLIREAKGKNLKLHAKMDPNVGVLWLFPGIQKKIVDSFLKRPIKGVVLQAFGVGNGPDNNKKFLKAIKKAVEDGIIIVDCTQCMRGTVNLEDYATGSALYDVGVISGYDMTVEAALTKLSYLFGRYHDDIKIKKEFQRNLRGELTKSRHKGTLPAYLSFSYR